MIVRNVYGAMAGVLDMFQHSTEKVYRTLKARGTFTWELREMPFITRYQCPEECVMMLPIRNANPFFHFFEALHMLAGRSDLLFMQTLLDSYKNYSDDGVTLHGAYGRRLVLHSQLDKAVEELRSDHDSRRAVVSIWQPEHDAGYCGKDMPCNCLVDFKIREKRLHMIVHNRSNDAIWGAYGSNAVQFSFLQQYVAMRLDCALGEYVQVSDSMHVYPDVEPTRTLLREPVSRTDPYLEGWVRPEPWVVGFEDADDWIADLKLFFHLFDEDKLGTSDLFHSIWWSEVAYPMWRAFTLFKSRNMDEAIPMAQSVRSSDWKTAAVQWLQRIERKRQSSNESQ